MHNSYTTKQISINSIGISRINFDAREGNKIKKCFNGNNQICLIDSPELKGRSAWKIARTRYLLSNTFRDYLNPSSGVECASSRANLAQSVVDKIHA
jgi:hypothetical protein